MSADREALRQQMLLRALWRDARPGVVAGWMRDDPARFQRGLQAYQGGTMGHALGAIELAARVKARYDAAWIIPNARRAVALAALNGNLHIRALADVDGRRGSRASRASPPPSPTCAARCGARPSATRRSSPASASSRASSCRTRGASGFATAVTTVGVFMGSRAGNSTFLLSLVGTCTPPLANSIVDLRGGTS